MFRQALQPQNTKFHENPLGDSPVISRKQG
jgi:hypothetical protein